MAFKLKFRPIWFDSLGAKSSCTFVETPDVKILIDPGVAVMHPSFPATQKAKKRWYEQAYTAIIEAAQNADVITISHYHYDHFIDFDKRVYQGKLILAKDPNKYINDSQRGRAEHFYDNLYSKLANQRLSEVMLPPKQSEYPDPMKQLKEALNRDFGDYQKRRQSLLEAGEKWFKARARKWANYPRIPALKGEKVEVRFADRCELKFGSTKIKLHGPLFHGVEYSRVGWVFAVVIEYGGEKLLHSSDLNGPVIEDYAQWIIEEQPDILILDGPMTYMLGYTLNLTNLRRTIENAVRIVEEASCRLIVYDHHLPREPKFREHTKPVWDKASRLGVKLVTAAELLNKQPVVLEK